MFDISKEGNIQLVRGDTLSLALFINQGNELVPSRYLLGDNDTVYFALMEQNQLFENAILKKVFTKETSEFTEDGDLIITLDPSDTENLLEGQYIYTIKLRTTNLDTNREEVKTVVTEHQFSIMN